MSVSGPIREPRPRRPGYHARRQRLGRQARYAAADALRSGCAGENRGRLSPFCRGSRRVPDRCRRRACDRSEIAHSRPNTAEPTAHRDRVPTTPPEREVRRHRATLDRPAADQASDLPASPSRLIGTGFIVVRSLRCGGWMTVPSLLIRRSNGAISIFAVPRGRWHPGRRNLLCGARDRRQRKLCALCGL